MELVFVTHNQHKLVEINHAINTTQIRILSLHDLGVNTEIPEPYATLAENASGKSKYIYERFTLNCFADDTGLEIEALNNEPGAFSARWAGAGCSYSDNVKKALRLMQGVENRNARFKTVISLILNGEEHLFEGKIEGVILQEPKGLGGFGYDPIFQPRGYHQSFAEMPLELKNKISHRGIAVRKLIAFLNNLLS